MLEYFRSMSTKEAFCFAAVLFLILVAIIIKIGYDLRGFRKTLHYINLDIRRSEGEERKYYIRQRRKLLLSLLPFRH